MNALLTVPEVADRLRQSKRFVLDELRRKNLRGSRFGGTWHIAEADLRTYIDAHANVRPVGKAAS
jgi:excisionase family DNA binding protein